MEREQITELLRKADEAKLQAYVPYSHFRVGACLLTKSGKTYTGCNVENATYGATICAERTAVVKAVSEGETEFSAIAVTADCDTYPYPCGICRQVLCEFSPDMLVIVAGRGLEGYRVHTASELLPEAFSEKAMK